MIPTVDNNHADEGNALLISRYQNAKVVAGMVKAVMNRIQKYENAIWQLINGVILDNHPMAGGPWDVLDKIGLIVGELRNGRDDPAYVAAIRLRVRVNRSNGLAEDIIQIAALLVTGAIYREWGTEGPMAFDLEIEPCTAAQRDALLTNLNQAREAASEGVLRQSAGAASTIIRWGSTVRPGSGTGFASSRLGPPRFTFCSARPMAPIPA
jgi:hypothetical protein